MFAIGNEELVKCKAIAKIVMCPHCHKRHRVTTAHGDLTSLSTVRCTKDGESYLVGFNGKEIPSRRRA